MENKFFSGIFGEFKEKRFVFVDGEPKASSGQADEAPVDGKKVEAEAEAKAEADKEAKKDNVIAKTSEYLQELKNSIGKDFGGLAELVNFDGEVFEGTVALGDFMKQKEDVSKVVLSKLKKKMEEQGRFLEEIDNLINFVWGLEGAAPLKVDSLQFIADVYTTSMLQAAEAGFKEKYPLFDSLPAKDYKIKYEISVANGGVSFLTKFEVDESFSAAYKQVEIDEGVSKEVDSVKKGDEGKKPDEDKEKKGEGEAKDDEKAAEEKKAEEDEALKKEANIKALKGSFLGGALSFLGIVKNDDWGDVVDGNNWLACLLVGMFGGGKFLSNDPFQDAVAGLDEKSKLLAEKAREKAQGSFFSLSKVEAKPVTPEEAKKLQEARSTYDGKKFAELIAGKKDKERILPQGVAKLGVDFEIKDGGKPAALVADLKNGGEMTVPPKSSVVVNGETEPSGDKEKTYKGVEMKITGTIPKGTVFKGKVGFEVVSETA